MRNGSLATTPPCHPLFLVPHQKLTTLPPEDEAATITGDEVVVVVNLTLGLEAEVNNPGQIDQTTTPTTTIGEEVPMVGIVHQPISQEYQTHDMCVNSVANQATLSFNAAQI